MTASKMVSAVKRAVAGREIASVFIANQRAGTAAKCIQCEDKLRRSYHRIVCLSLLTFLITSHSLVHFAVFCPLIAWYNAHPMVVAND